MGFLRIILFFVLFSYLWRAIKKYWPKVSNINDQPKSNPTSKNKPNFKIDKSNIEDAEFTEIDEDK